MPPADQNEVTQRALLLRLITAERGDHYCQDRLGTNVKKHAVSRTGEMKPPSPFCSASFVSSAPRAETGKTCTLSADSPSASP